MKKQGKIDKAAYRRYIKMFEAEKKDHNIIFKVRRYTYGQYVTRRKAGYSNRDLVDNQSKFTQEQKKAIWKSYQKNRTVKRGDKYLMEETYWGGTLYNNVVEKIPVAANEARYHRSIGGLLGAENQVHLLIANRINNGEKKEDILAEYGIIDY